jgi:hypothetical protein
MRHSRQSTVFRFAIHRADGKTLLLLIRFANGVEDVSDRLNDVAHCDGVEHASGANACDLAGIDS